MSAPQNMVESTSIAEPTPSDEEVIDIAALAQQLKDAEARNARIKKKKQDRVAEVKKKEEEQDRIDEVERLAWEAEQKTEKVNKKKQVSAILNFCWSRLMELDLA